MGSNKPRKERQDTYEPPRLLTQSEIESLRQEMKESGERMKAKLEKRKEQE
jgi:hypothetical protein